MFKKIIARLIILLEIDLIESYKREEIYRYALKNFIEKDSIYLLCPSIAGSHDALYYPHDDSVYKKVLYKMHIYFPELYLQKPRCNHNSSMWFEQCTPEGQQQRIECLKKAIRLIIVR